MFQGSVQIRIESPFTSEGEKTIYVKFADANGLESGILSDSIVIDSSASSTCGDGVCSADENETSSKEDDISSAPELYPFV